MKRQTRGRSEHGAIVIQVAIALLALLSFTVFVVDYGVMWVARREAQNAADAGALAGGMSLIRDGGGEPQARNSALYYAGNNYIWGEANSALNVDVTLSKAGTSIPPCGENPGCVRVDVYRNMPDRVNVTRGTTLPVFFGPMLGITQQGVRATATAETQAGNMIRCMLPFAVADRWSDATDNFVGTYAYDGLHLASPPNPIGGWSPNDLYEDTAGGGSDSYTPPYHPGHTGWTVNGDANRPGSGDYGRQVILKEGEVGQFSAGWANKVDLPGSVGADDYRDDIRGCNGTAVAIAKEDEDCVGYPNSGTTIEEAKAGCLGVSSGLSQGPTKQGVESNGGGGALQSLYHQDPAAEWDPDYVGVGPNGQPGAVVDGDGEPNMSSPRVRPVAVFDIAHYMQNPNCMNQAGTGCVVKVANIIGFFIEGMCDTVKKAGRLAPGNDCGPGPAANSEVVGRIVTLPSNFAEGAGSVTEDAAFLKIVRLVR